MSQPKSAEQAQQEIEQAGASNSDAQRVIENIEVGQAIRQGDIYVRRIAESGVSLGPRTESRQLAPGQTRGARHMVEGEAEVYADKTGQPLMGPIIVASKRFRITHPEHAHFSLPAGTYQVTYQRDFEKVDITRVID